MGRPPSIPESPDIFLALLILEKEGMGRYNLASYLQQTKAKTRAILEYLILVDLAESHKGRGGTRLTKKGRELLKKISGSVLLDWQESIVRVDRDQEFIPSGDEYALCLLRSDDVHTQGLYERDLAVRAGASGAITLKSSGTHWVYPDESHAIQPKALVSIDPASHQYDWMIIAFGPSKGSAYAALSRIIQYHCGEVLELLP